MKNPKSQSFNRIIAVLGAPASGKGTLCKRAASDPRFNRLLHVSVGDLLRGMPSGPDINGHIAAGTVLAGNEIVPILAAHISSLSHTSTTEQDADAKSKIVLLDGFPRSLEQEEAARTGLASELEGEFPDLAVYFECPKDVLKARYVARRREVDDADLFEKRFEQHERECPAVIERYKEKGILVEIDSSGSMEESYEALVRVLEGSHLASILRPR